MKVYYSETLKRNVTIPENEETESPHRIEQMQLCNALAGLTHRSRITMLKKEQAQLALLFLAQTIGEDTIRNAIDYAEKF